jgi:tetratricopeptide (TPR) repeat protein
MEHLQTSRVSQLTYFTEIQLADFTPQQAEQLIGLKLRQFFGSQVETPQGLVGRITERAQGNPFYIEELLNYLQDRGVAPTDNQALEQLDLPTSLHSLILSRIDQLTEHQKTTLKVASVIGRLFKAAMVWGAYPQLGDESQIKADLDALSRLDLTPLDAPEPELVYLFKHIMTQEVAYETLPYATRARLHDRIGQYIEAAYPDTLDQYIHLLAHHYWRGEDWPKAMEYNLRTALQAQREFANDTAVAGYQRTLEAAAKVDGDTTDKRLLAHESLGEVLMLTGRYDEALAQYTSARALVEPERPFDDQACHLADLCRKTADVHERRSEYVLAFEWLNKGLSHLDQDQPTIELARIYNRGTLLYRRQAKYEEAISWCQKTLDTASGIQTRDGQRAVAHAYYNLAEIYWRRGDLTQAAHYCRESVQIYQDLDDIAGLAEALNNLSNVYAERGDWDQAVEALRQSLALEQEIGYVYAQAVIANNLGLIHLDRGEWDQAVTLLEKSRDIYRQLGSAWGEGSTLINLARLRVVQADWAEAQACLTRSQDLFDEVGSEEFLPELELRWAEFYLTRAASTVTEVGELDQALEHAQRAIELAVGQQAPLEEAMAYRLKGEIHLTQGEVELAGAALRRSLQILTDSKSEYEAAKTMLALVRLSLADDSVAVDRDRLTQAIQTFERLGARADLAQARALEGGT